MALTLAKTESKTIGYAFLLVGILAELFILFGSVVKGSNIASSKPWLYPLAQLIPLIFIEASLRRIRESETFTIGELEPSNVLDETALTVRRSYSIYKGIKGVIFSTILLIGLALWIAYMAFNGRLEFKLHTLYTFGFLALYFLAIRPAYKLLSRKIKHSTRNIGLKYQFDGDFLLLEIPLNPLQKKIARIPLSKIEYCKIPNGAEYISLMQSYKSQYTVGISQMKGLMDFAKDKIPYPQYYMNTINPANAIYLKGKYFAYLISVLNKEYFVDEVQRRKNG
ncbi:MAG: hypothetical protein Q7S27_05745 [Nanoarchaeota archaeon]|nr:hypothetical protein [Nanoarchaeota archaeon]